MSQIAQMNPWLTMWSQPKSTIRSLISTKPAYGVYYLATIYALQSFFFYANYWSLGLNVHFPKILLTALILSPVAGFVWLFFSSFILYLTGRLLKGEAPMAHLRTVLAWSKIPYSINLVMWFILIFINADYSFIQNAGGPSSIFINFITLIVGVWSFVLLIQSLQEVQKFSLLRAFSNLLLAWVVCSLVLFLIFSLFRFVYIYF